MPAEFHATTRALDHDGHRSVLLALVLGLPLLAAWSLWVGFATIPIRVVSRAARVEVDQLAHPIEAPVSGRIVAVHVRQGDQVRRGAALVELDAEGERLALAEAMAELSARRAELAAIGAQIDVERDALAIERDNVDTATAEARARLRQAEVASSHARARNDLLERLADAGFVADTERADARAAAEQNDANAQALRRSVDGVHAGKRLGVVQRRSAIEALARQAAALAGQITTAEAKLDRLRLEIDRRTIRAPVDGTMVELAPWTVGATTTIGARIGVLLPAGALRVIAEFDPAGALGRVREGQRATVRLDGFPWAQFGALDARVARVAGEIRDGTVRVVLAIESVGDAVVLQHGLPGTVDIDVEAVTPAVLVLRAAGHLLARPVAATIEAHP